MAGNGSNDGYPYPWGGNTGSDRPDLRHQISSISAVSAMDPYDEHELRHMPSTVSAVSSIGHRESMSSLALDFEGPRSQSVDEVDISRVRISSVSSSGVSSPVSGSESHGLRTAMLPESLRAGRSTPTPTSPATRVFNPFRSSAPVYQPISTGAPDISPSSPVPNRPASKRFSKRRSGSLLNMSHGAIPEGEEIDMSLLGSATPMGFSKAKTSYSALEEDDQEDSNPLSPTAAFDVSTFTGPIQSEAQLREINRQEAAGILTGGLGAGLKPDSTITSTDLYANAPQSPRTPAGVNRRMSFRASTFRTPSFKSPGLARKQTVRELGQIEANKRGEIIEVIVEEPTFDISTFSGGGAGTSNVDFDLINGSKQNRKSTVPAATVEVFYPQANWKPFSMRWPYLMALAIISIVLAGAQEYVLQKSMKAPLYSFTSAAALNTWEYFSFKYLPTMVAVTFGILWQITDFEVKRLEAYYQLSKEGGALAAESINVDYITFFNFLRPIRALQFKHYAVAVSSLATLIAVSLVPTLQAASIELTPSRQEREQFPDRPKEIHILSSYSRCLSVILVLIAIMACILLWQLERRRSGLVADVKGIAGIAAMANRSHILTDFKDMDTATPDMIHHKLKSHRYSLRNSSLAPEDKITLTQEEKDKYDQQNRAGNPHPLMLRLVAGIPFIIGMVLYMIIVPIIIFQPSANVITDKAPWLLTAFAVCIKLAWGTLETDVRMIEPFYILSKRHASPKVLTLDYTAMAFGWMPIRALLNGHFLVGLVGLGSVLAEILTVCSTSFANVSGADFAKKPPPSPPSQLLKLLFREASPGEGVNAGEETFLSFWISFSLALAVVTFLCLVATFVYLRRRHPFLPRQPNTIASILAFIHQSKMLYDFVGTEKMNNDEMVARLAKIGKTYGLGWFLGRDGEMHCGIDEEELSSNYKHGDDARQASQPWTTNWENY